MKVGEVMTLEVHYVEPRDGVLRAAELMRDLDVGMLPVVESGAVAGVLTGHDLAVRLVAESRDPARTTAADLMSREVVYVYEDEELEAAARLMKEKGLRRLVVLDRENELVGIVSRGDLERAEPSVLSAASRASSGAAKAAEAVNALIQDELAAVESYRLAVGRVHGPAIAELRRLENEHEKAAALLQQAVAERGIEPAITAGARGVWSRLVEGAASLLGEDQALRALKEGEEHGVRDYERALGDAALFSDVRALIQSDLLPVTREHIPTLDRFLHGRGPSGLSYNADQGYGPAGGGRGVA